MTNRKALIRRITKLEGDDDPYYFDSSKSDMSVEELIDLRILEMETSPEFAELRESRRLEEERRKAERDERSKVFLEKRELELAALDAEDAK